MIELELKIFNKKTLKKISPIFIDIIKIKNENVSTQIWQEQFKINELNNTIKFSSDFERNEYQLSVGFYLMDELHTKFPPRYMKSFKLKII